MEQYKLGIGKVIPEDTIKKVVSTGKFNREEAIQYIIEKNEERQWIIDSILKAIVENELIEFHLDDNKLYGQLYMSEKYTHKIEENLKNKNNGN